jgi:cell division protein FtsW (lipid II flippase)
MLAVHIPGFGVFRNGSYRWISVPGTSFNIQVSDIAKIVFVFALGLAISDAQRHLHSKKKYDPFTRSDEESVIALKSDADTAAAGNASTGGWTLNPFVRVAGWPWLKPSTPAWREFISGFLPPLLVIGVMCGILAKEPDYGTLALFAAVGLLLFIIGGAKLRYLIPTLLAGVPVFCFLISTKPDRMRRLAAFMDPEGMRLNEGAQVYQSMMALGLGGPTGVGIGNGIQQRYWLPEAHTDFIYAIIGEEAGLVGTGCVALCFLAIYVVVLLNLRRAHNAYQFNICLGAMLFIVLQALINMSVVTGLFPTTGMSLPFISYGGTGLVTMFALAGLIFNCLFSWRHPPVVKIGEISTAAPPARFQKTAAEFASAGTPAPTTESTFP